MMVISAGVVGFNGLIGWGVMRAAVTSPAIQRNSVAFLFRLFFFFVRISLNETVVALFEPAGMDCFTPPPPQPLSTK